MLEIREEFYSGFSEYDAADPTQLAQLQDQIHTDIRTFESNEISVRINMLYLDLLTMLSLNQRTVGDLDGTLPVRATEQWTNTGTGVTVSKQADRNNANGLSMTCNAGPNITSSVLRLPPLTIS